ARDPALAEEDGQGEALEEGEIDVDVEGLGLGGGEALEDSEKGLAHLQQMVEPLPQGEIGQVVAADFHAEEGGKLLVLFDESVLPVGTENMVTMLDLLESGVQLAAKSTREADAEDVGNLVGGQPPKPEFTGALEDLVDREIAPEDE